MGLSTKGGKCMNYKETAKKLVELVGGTENIESVKHCMTRVRFVLKDESKADVEGTEKLKGVMKVVKSAGQYQVVVGSDKVDELTRAVSEFTGISEKVVRENTSDKNQGDKKVAVNTENENKKKKPMDVLMDYVVSIFIPIMPIFIGGGIIKGLLTLAVNLGLLSADSGVYIVYYAVADGFMYFMPFIMAYLAGKKFGCNIVISLGIAAAMFYPNLNTAITSDEGLSFLGIHIAKPSEFSSGVYYANNVFAMIMAVALLAFVEKTAKKMIKNKNLQNVLVPLLSLVIVTPVTFCLFGPISTYVGNGIAYVYQAILNFSPILGGAVLGGIWQIMIMFGMHWSFVPLAISLFAANGYSTFDAYACIGTLCMQFIPLAIAMKTKDKELRTDCISIFASCILGSVVEPALYGVALRFKKTFAIGCIGGAIGGALAALFGAYSSATSGLTLYTIPLFVDCGLWRILVPFVISVAFTMIATYFFGYSDKDLKKEEQA